MTQLRQFFTERVDEVHAYLALLSTLEVEVQSGTPHIGNIAVSVKQQRILNAAVYLHLYNLVEATVTRCLDHACALPEGRSSCSELSDALRKEWIRSIARTHTQLNYENRLTAAITLVEQVIACTPLKPIRMDRGGGGNWDDKEIGDFLEKRLGISLRLRPETLTAVKRRVSDDNGAVTVVKRRRNDLAHGRLSFFDCGETTHAQLAELASTIIAFLSEVIEHFERFDQEQEFLAPQYRSANPSRTLT